MFLVCFLIQKELKTCWQTGIQNTLESVRKSSIMCLNILYILYTGYFCQSIQTSSNEIHPFINKAWIILQNYYFSLLPEHMAMAHTYLLKTNLLKLYSVKLQFQGGQYYIHNAPSGFGPNVLKIMVMCLLPRLFISMQALPTNMTLSGSYPRLLYVQ